MNAIVVPMSSSPIAIRTATLADLPFMDALQKRHSKQLGYFPTKQFEGYIEGGHVLVAEERHEGTEARRHEGRDEEARERVDSLPASPPHSRLRASVPSCLRASPLGYVISRDRYLKRDELGVIYQLCVAPGHQRGLIGATLVKEVFARSAYGCRLYCCWCAQDLEANHFWESLGFVPIAFRAGSAGKKRVHIFWQRRVNEVSEYRGVGVSESQSPHADTPTPRHPHTPAPYWYPFQTNNGAIREDRIVFPIPPGVHWSEVKPVAVPSERGLGILPGQAERAASRKRSGETPKPRGTQPRLPAPRSPLTPRPSPLPHQVGILVGGRIKYVMRPGYVEPVDQEKKRKSKREPKEKRRAGKIDPKYLAAAREFRDRYLERVNAEPGALPAPAARYDVSRSSPAAPAASLTPVVLPGPAAQVTSRPRPALPPAA